MTSPIIRAQGLTKRFGTFTAVDDLSLAVMPGSIFAFLGANGSGKSTTIRMLIGLLQPTAGAIEVDGVDVMRQPRKVRDHIGYMGQRVSLYRGLSLRENVDFYGGLQGLAGAALDARWADVRERFALADAEREHPEDLSAGLRQRAGPYFRIALGDPDIAAERDFLIERSPRTYLHQLACPLLVIQGKNDPRVVAAESQDLVENLRRQGKQVDFILFENEGHDVLKYENRVACYNAITSFFKSYLTP